MVGVDVADGIAAWVSALEIYVATCWGISEPGTRVISGGSVIIPPGEQDTRANANDTLAQINFFINLCFLSLLRLKI